MYIYTWKKYLPVIRLLLKKSAIADQVATLNHTDFEKSSRARKPACSFTIELVNGRFKMVSQSTSAKNLLEVLMEDEAAKALLRKNHYAISLNSDFQLNIKNLTPPIEEEAVVAAENEQP
ncbi:MAG TPA: hypothetical protein VF487_13125 [Chitinophagaceae bacterium]